MKDSTLLVLLGKSGLPADINGWVDLARTHKLFLAVAVVGEAPDFPSYGYGMGQYGLPVMVDDWQKDVDKEHAALAETGKTISEHLAAQGVECNVSIICAERAALSEAIARRAMVCDLVLVSHDLRERAELFDQVVQTALFRAPTGVMLNGGTSPAALAADRVLVAWQPTQACARAVHAAMPIMRAAKEVTLVVIDPVMTPWRDGDDPGADAAHWLSHQGCKVTVQQSPSGGQDIGHVVLQHAREKDAQLIVMGAYDHSRLREIVFGGTTRTLVAQREHAVLMAH
jgi:nucleotide-binding universal stress UspA family protein